MRKCKFLGYSDGEALSLIKGKIYSYEISGIDTSFPYHIYDNVKYSPIATYSKGYFNALFIDIKKQRKEKLIEIYSKL